MKKILYKNKERNVIIIHKPSDSYLMFDLSEYSDEEKKYYEDKFKEVHKQYLAEIKDIGLNSNYRNFKEDKIEWLDKEETT